MGNKIETLSIFDLAPEKTASRESDLGRVFRLMRRFLVGQRCLLMMALVMLTIEAITAVFAAYPLSYLVDYLKGDRPDLLQVFGLPQFLSPRIATVLALTLAIVLAAMINSAADSMAEIYLARGGRMLGFNLRVGVYDHLQRLSLAFFNRQRTGDILTRVTSDVAALEDFVINSLSDIIGSLLVLAGTLAYLSYRSWEVALVAALIVPGVALVSDHFALRIKAAAKRQRAREGELASAAQEALTSIGVIQTYGRGGNELERFAERNQKTMEVALETARIQAIFSWVIKLLEALSTVAIVWLGLWLIDRSAITIGTLILFVILIERMFRPTKKIVKEWNKFGKMYASAERIGELLERRPAVEDQPGAVTAPAVKGHIEYRQVDFAYPSEAEDDRRQREARVTLRDINLEIAPGEVLALVGPSGAGKSTIVQLLPRLYDPGAGQVLIDGHDIKSFTLDSLRRRMSIVLQETVLFHGTVAENIAYGCDDATREEIVTAAIQANAHEFIEKLPEGYDTDLGERAASLSGGQRQRIAISRAFIRKTPILILDEPTTGLDSESTELVLTALRTLMSGKSTIIISHDLNLIRHADKIAIINDGRVERIGTHQELLQAGGLYAELYDKQFGRAVEEEIARIQPILAPPARQHRGEDDEDDFEEDIAGIEPEVFRNGERKSPEVFQTLMTRALQQPLSSKVFDKLQSAVDVPAASSVAPASLAPAPKQDAAAAFMIFEGEARFRAGLFVAPAPSRVPAAPNPDEGALDPQRSPVLQQELAGLRAAFDGEAMRSHLQAALLDGSNSRFRIVRCEPGDAGFLPDGSCLLRYELEVTDGAGEEPRRTLVSARLCRDEFACAAYLRDKLAPLATLMRGRPEVAPFATPVARIRPLNMAVHVFPIDGELPALLDVTNQERMARILGETLPEAIGEAFVIERCEVGLVDYSRHSRAVLRYEVEGRREGRDREERKTVYGKVFSDNSGALAVAATAALRERVAGTNGARLINVPMTYGWRPELRLLLLQTIPGERILTETLKARLHEKPSPAAALSLEGMIEACGRTAALLHTSNIKLGRRRTLQDELLTLRDELAPIQRISPTLGTRLRGWIEKIEVYAERFRPLPFCFSHGDFTRGQLLFDGATAGLVDFDSVCQAEPALDLGQFLAYLRLADKRGDESSTAGELIDRLRAKFLDAYVAATGRKQRENRLRLRVSIYENISLLRRTIRSWHKFRGDRMESALVILEEGMARLPRIHH